MSLVRNTPERGQTRSFGFRAYHKELKKLVRIHEVNFDSVENIATVSMLDESLPTTAFRVHMKDLVLLEDTSRKDKNNKSIYEGDRVRAKVQNEFGSWEMLEGTVLFDENKWGFGVEFERKWNAALSGAVDEVEIIGNMFENGET